MGLEYAFWCEHFPTLLAYAISKGSGETARMRRLVRVFEARRCDKYKIACAGPNYYCKQLYLAGIFIWRIWW